jgi:hypothetical protein
MTPERFRPLRERYTEDELALGRGRAGTLSPFPAIVGRVFGNPTVPTHTGCYFSIHPVGVAGVEAEAAPGALTVDGSDALLVYVIGPKAPVAGEDLVCHFVGNRWVAERMTTKAPQTVYLPGCPCTALPQTLHLSVNKPYLDDQIFHNCTLQYGPTPPALRSLSLGDYSFLSTQTFNDAVTSDQYWFYFTCYQGYYMITRVYINSVFGSPFRDVVRYKWVVGFPGNTCSPLLLSHGQPYPGGDPTCVVTISE